MKKESVMMIFYFLFGSAVFTGCKREMPAIPSPNPDLTQTVNQWLSAQVYGKEKSVALNIELLKRALVFSNEWSEKSGNGESLLIIPVSDEFNSNTGMDKNVSAGLLLFFTSEGAIRSGNIFLFTASGGMHGKIMPGTFYHIFNTGQPENEGKFQFLSVDGTPQYELQYSNRHLVSSGIYEPKKNIPALSRTSVATCYDWYLVTTWYDQFGGVTEQTYVYLYTSCGGCANKRFMSLCANDEETAMAGCCISDPTATIAVRPVVADPGVDNCGFETRDPVTGIRTKTCSHSWYFVTNSIMWYNWKYGSAEQGVEVNEATGWRFSSVAHQGLLTSGTVPPCIHSDCSIASAIGSFSGSTAKMNLIYSQNISLACRLPGGLSGKTSTASSQWFAK